MDEVDAPSKVLRATNLSIIALVSQSASVYLVNNLTFEGVEAAHGDCWACSSLVNFIYKSISMHFTF